ncbi:MAG TPA: class D beta-lactamase [Agriterribacter sp.]|mgnify:CR=1 FL=1|nr:class D beta-lactamase [Agriterribacter sp.]
MKITYLFPSVLAVAWLFISSCSMNNVEQDSSLKKYFDQYNVEGSFALFDNGRGKFLIYNLERDTSRMLPASTFKIVNALVALQTGVLTTDSSVVKWDGVQRENAQWNQDLNLAEAFKYSAVPHFQEIARRIGRDTMQKWIDSLKYGNMKIGPAVDSFWLDNSLEISPDEEMGLVKKLYFDQLPFRKSVQQSVRNMMVQEDNSNYSISYKTGWGINKKNHSVGWVVGWIEENKHPYFFVLNIETPDTGADISSIRLNILNSILKREGFFEGKM